MLRPSEYHCLFQRQGYPDLKHELKQVKIKENKKLNCIDILDIEEIGNRDDYIFVMSCNYNYFPKIKKDEDYLIDEEKKELGISTSKEINKNNIESIKVLLKNSKNIILTYKDKSYFNEYHKVDYLNNLEVKEYKKDILKSYSINEDKILSWTISQNTENIKTPDPVDLNPFDEWTEDGDTNSEYEWEEE